MAKRKKADTTPPQWLSGPDAYREFATHKGGTQSARHIKPLHWYIASRLVIEGGFPPTDVTPRPPFRVEEKGPKGKRRFVLHHDAAEAVAGEQVVLGGLKTKNVDVDVNRHPVGPVIAVSCKGVTKAFRNLTNRMEETIGECTNLHITYPAMVIGYFAILRANRTIQDALEAPDLPDEDAVAGSDPDEMDDAQTEEEQEPTAAKKIEKVKRNDIAILDDGRVVDGIQRFHAALRDMTLRRGIRDEISRYEAMTMALIDPQTATAGSVLSNFPPPDSPLLLQNFFKTLYERYDERFVYGAPSLADRGFTTRRQWDPDSPVFDDALRMKFSWPAVEYDARLASD